MLRTSASRLASRSLATSGAQSATFGRVASPVQWSAKFTSMASKRPQKLSMAQLKPIQAAVFRRTLADKIDHKAEDRYAHEKIKPTPETVSTTSSTHAMFSEVGVKNPENDIDMTASIKHDLGLVKETFDMSTVPRQAYYIGLAGVLPYLGTSLSTVVCAWEITHSTGGHGLVMSPQTAETLLHILEHVQVGYGAVILSFLSAIHWGLEFAGYGGYQGYKRYAIGVAVPAIAWPTLLMPVEYALISQFAAFTVLYYVDVRATYRGWTPPWYAIYRFVLTFIVGVSIVASLVGRGEVSSQVKRQPGTVDKITALREAKQEALVREEEEVRSRKAIEEATKGKEEAKTDDDNSEDEEKDEGKDESKDKVKDDDTKDDDEDEKKDEKKEKN